MIHFRGIVLSVHLVFVIALCLIKLTFTALDDHALTKYRKIPQTNETFQIFVDLQQIYHV